MRSARAARSTRFAAWFSIYVDAVLRGVIWTGIYALPLVPLLLIKPFYFAAISEKGFALRIIVEIVTGAWLALALVSPRDRPPRSWVLAAFAGFVVVMGIADLHGALPYKSIWSNFEWMEGWIGLVHLLAYLTVLISMVATERDWRRLWEWSLAVSALIAGIGLVEFVVDFHAMNNPNWPRIGATFGNPIYLAVYMLVHVFIAVLLWLQPSPQKGGIERRWGRRPYAAVAMIDALALLLSGSRGVLLGLIGGAFLSFTIYTLSPGARRGLRWGVPAILLVLVTGFIGLHLAGGTEFVQQVGVLKRLAELGPLDTNTQMRIANLEVAWQGVQERPLLGWGQENYPIVVDKYYDTRLLANLRWDRVHESILDWLIAGGVLGLLSYLGLFAAAAWCLMSREAFDPIERSVLAGLVGGYFAQDLTAFNTVTSWLLFTMLLGYLASRRAAAARPLWRVPTLPAPVLPLAAAICLAASAWAVYAINIPAIAANRALVAAFEPSSEGWLRNIALFGKAIRLDTFGTEEIRIELGQFALQVALNQGDPAARETLARIAVPELDIQATLSPDNSAIPLLAGQILYAAGDYDGAASHLARAHQLRPAEPEILTEMAQTALARKRVDEANEYLRQAKRLGGGPAIAAGR